MILSYIPKELYSGEVLCDDKNLEVRVSENYLLYRIKKAFLRSEKITLINLNEVKYCYYSHTAEYKNCIAGFIFKNGEIKELTRAENTLIRKIFESSDRVVQGFEKPDLPIEMGENPLKYAGEEYKIVENRLIYSKNGKEKVIVDDIGKLSYCTQSHSTSGPDDEYDEYCLWLYNENETDSEYLSFISAKNCFLTAVAIKRHAPQLKYK